jgi:hypothetical protein
MQRKINGKTFKDVDCMLKIETIAAIYHEIFSYVIKEKFGKEKPKKLHLGIKEGGNRPILRVISINGKESSFGYLYSFFNYKTEKKDSNLLADLSNLETDIPELEDIDQFTIDQEFKLIALSLVIYQWKRHVDAAPVPMKKCEISIYNDWEEGSIVERIGYFNLPDEIMKSICNSACKLESTIKLVMTLNKNEINSFQDLSKLKMDKEIDKIIPIK